MPQTITKILVPIDFSDNSRNCLQTAIAISSRQKASLILLHVLENKVKLNSSRAHIKLQEYFSLQLEAIGHAIKNDVPEHKIKILEETLPIHTSINLIATEEKADLIIMGKFGLGGSLKFNIGSTIKNTIQNYTIPILMVPSEGSWLKLNRIVLPVRLIQGEFENYEFIRPIIHKNKAELLIAGFSKSDAPGKVKELLSMVKDIKSKYTQDEVTTSTRFSVTQTIGWEVNAYAKSFYADLIVLTSEIDDDQVGFYSGTYTRQILSYSMIPILCVGTTNTKKKLTF